MTAGALLVETALRLGGNAGLVLLEIPYPRIDPVLLDLPGPLALRWYSLMYIVGFTVGYFILRWLARKEFLRLPEIAVGDFLVWLAFGLLIGARVGYVLFYATDVVVENPLRLFAIWEGGLSFHGGLIGMVVAALWFGRRHGVPFLNLADGIVLAAPFGIFFVRCANFINGELYGRVTTEAVPWAMRFPTDPRALQLLGADAARSMREREVIINRAFDSSQWEAVMHQVPLRHPSQLYEAIGEGLLLAAILWLVFWLLRRRGTRPMDGFFGALFLIGYGVFRSIAELFRQPDPQFRGPDDPIGTVLGPLTMGQTLSALMIVGGIGLLVWLFGPGRRRASRPARRRSSG